MLIVHIRKLQEILTNVQRNSLSGEINFIFNQSGHNLPFTITSFKVVRADQEIDLYNILNIPTNEEYSKKFNNQLLSFKYIHQSNHQEQLAKNDVHLLIDLMAIFLNERLEDYFEKENIENILHEQNEESAALIRMFCHDLVNPLSILNMSIEFLEDEDENKVFTKTINRMKKSSESLLRIIQSIRELNALQVRRKTLTLETLSLHSVFTECKTNFKDELAQKNINLELILPQNKDVEFLADRETFLNYIFQNLISNAIKFSRENSNIAIVAEKIADQLHLSIIDHGVGMNNQQLSKIFKFDKAMQRLGTQGEAGHGFGLQFCRYALKLHGFKFHISSLESKNEESPGGTVVKLTIPMSA